MRYFFKALILPFILFFGFYSNAQEVQEDCFFYDFQPKTASIPEYTDLIKPNSESFIEVKVFANDTIARISDYLFGNSATLYTSQYVDQAKLMKHLTDLKPSLIRYPGGSLADVFFWDGKPNNLAAPGVPDSLVNSDGVKEKFWPWMGKNNDGWTFSTTNYYKLREQTGSEGLITINYAYARYGTTADPIAQAAHYAADWVRFDNGRTKFWEIGNENGGPWEAGWRIDTSTNKDGQPEIISGALYGKHVKQFADSMRVAAAEVGIEIFIGAQILHFDGKDSWNSVDRTWDSGYFEEAGNTADYYVTHNYFGTTGTQTASKLLASAIGSVGEMKKYIRANILNNGGEMKPYSVTEWNMGATGNMRNTSFISGVQGMIIYGEMLKNDFSMSCRWNFSNSYSDGEGHGMFNEGGDKTVPRWNPRPDFYYHYFLKKVLGDHLLKSQVNGTTGIVSYLSGFGSGEIGGMIINRSTVRQNVKLTFDNFAPGDRYYLYSINGGTDNGEFSQSVWVNGNGPDAANGGPVNSYTQIKALSATTDGGILFESEPFSIQYILVEKSTTGISLKENFSNFNIYPNPSKGTFTVNSTNDIMKSISIFDITGKLVLNKKLNGGEFEVSINPELNQGIYLVKVLGNKTTYQQKIVIN